MTRPLTVQSAELALSHISAIVDAVDVPVNADFQAGYADDVESLAENVRRCVATAVAGLSIEDGTGRAECFLYGHPDLLNEAIARLHAYAEAGADVLFAPGVRRKGDISSLVNALRPYPVNVLVSTDIGLTVTDLAELGVRRISVGSALSRVAWGAFLRATRRLAGNGGFEGLADAATFDELNEMFSQP